MGHKQGLAEGPEADRSTPHKSRPGFLAWLKGKKLSCVGAWKQVGVYFKIFQEFLRVSLIKL